MVQDRVVADGVPVEEGTWHFRGGGGREGGGELSKKRRRQRKVGAVTLGREREENRRGERREARAKPERVPGPGVIAHSRILPPGAVGLEGWRADAGSFGGVGGLTMSVGRERVCEWMGSDGRASRAEGLRQYHRREAPLSAHTGPGSRGRLPHPPRLLPRQLYLSSGPPIRGGRRQAPKSFPSQSPARRLVSGSPP